MILWSLWIYNPSEPNDLQCRQDLRPNVQNGLQCFPVNAVAPVYEQWISSVSSDLCPKCMYVSPVSPMNPMTPVGTQWLPCLQWSKWLVYPSACSGSHISSEHSEHTLSPVSVHSACSGSLDSCKHSKSSFPSDSPVHGVYLVCQSTCSGSCVSNYSQPVYLVFLQKSQWKTSLPSDQCP